jgi:plasmid stabilization system protein ParE
MAPVPIRFHPAAAQEAVSAYDWYAARDSTVAVAFRDELQHAVEAGARNPHTWPRHAQRTRRYVFPRFPFSLIYRVRGDEAEVIAVAHAKRRPGCWRSRL